MSRALCLQAVQNSLSALNAPPNGLRLLLALSGGSDSVALLAALCELRAVSGVTLHAVYVQHGLRGESALAEEQAVDALCRRLQVPLTVCRAQLTGDMHTPGVEQRARKERYRLFAQVYRQVQADALLLAHHRDDQAETVLMRLCRGAGADGLCGMHAQTAYEGMTVLRPFLALPKAVLREALEAYRLPHCEDESNADPCTDRNRIRLLVLPQLKQLYGGADGAIARAATLLQSDNECLQAMAEKLLAQARFAPTNGVVGVWRHVLRPQHAALRTRVLRRLFQTAAQLAGEQAQERTLTCEETEALDNAVQTGSGMNLPLGLALVCNEHWALLCRQNALPLRQADDAVPLAECVGKGHFAVNGLVVTADFEMPHTPPQDACTAVLPPDWQSQGLLWRTMQPGDRIHPFGAAGAKPLRRYFTDRKIPKPLRATLPILCRGSTVLWIPGLCTAESLRVEQGGNGGLRLTVQNWHICSTQAPNE